MDLREYIAAFPRRERMGVRRRLAAAHGVREVTVRAWANGTRRHPCTLAAVEITERETGGRVTRHDLRPDVYGPPPAEGPADKKSLQKSSCSNSR